MSAREAADESRRKPLLGVLFWVGVGLAPLAALLLLLGQGNGPLRIAAVLAVLAVVLIGLSITLGRGADDARLDLEETLLEEIDDLRGELRNDIATAARATHKAFGEKLEAVQGNVEALRGQLDAVRAEAESGRTPAARPTAAATVGTAVASAAVGGAVASGAVAPGRARVESDQAGWASTASSRPDWSPSDTASAGWGPGASAPGMPARNDAEARGDARAWGDGGARDEGRRDAAGYGDAWRAEAGPGPARSADQGRAGRFPVHPRAGFDAAGSDGGGYPDDEPTGAGRTTYGRADAEPDLGSGPPPGQYGRPAGQPWAQAGPQHAGPQHAGPQHAGSQYGGPQYGGQHSGLSGRHFGPGVVRHTETVQVTTRQTIVGGHEDAPLTGGGYGAGGYGGTGQSGTYGSGTYGSGTHGSGTNGSGSHGGGTYGGGSHGGGTYGGGSYGGGVYGGAGQGGDHGDGAYNAGGRDTYGAGRPDRDERGGDRDERGGDRDERGGDRDERERDRTDRGGNPDERGGEQDGRNRRAGWGWRPGGSDDGAGDDRRTGGGGWRERFADPAPETGDPADDSYWADLRAGDRWTSVRADERGREVRMGERRASMRSDESGTELRVEDRWAEVRQQEPRTDDARRAGRDWPESRDEERRPSGQRGSGDWPAADDGRRADRRDDGRGVEAGDGQGWERPGTAPALPSGGVGQAALWGTPRQEPDAEPDRRSRRQREDEEYGYPPLDESPRAGGTRRSGYNYADDGWR